jgi:hypothetical protein
MELRDESDVRRWFKKKSEAMGAEVFWVEAASGGTQGLPDAIAVVEGHSFYAELKIGTRKGKFMEFEMDNTQRKTLRRLEKAGADVAVLVAEKDTSTIWAGKPSELKVKPTNRKVTKVRGRCAHTIPLEGLPIKADEW